VTVTNGGPLTLAIVDDDEDVRTALSRLLYAMGHDVRAFASAEEFEAETRLRADCVILDVRLPGLSGLELRERLRDGNRPVPVVLITGGAERLSRDTVDPCDTPLVTKPFDDVRLTAAIAAAIAGAVSRERHAS
jgi:FixJ family two-component response regulator